LVVVAVALCVWVVRISLDGFVLNKEEKKKKKKKKKIARVEPPVTLCHARAGRSRAQQLKSDSEVLH
jgi:hypothetical protein